MGGCQARMLAALHLILCLVIALLAPPSLTGEPGVRDVLNLTAIYSARQRTSLQDLAGFWSYNETFDISKYEDFDHSKFLDVPGIKFESPALGEGAAGAGEGLGWPDGELGEFASPPPHGLDLPAFDNTLVTNISAQLGGTAFLHCRVRNANELRVSWVRRRDWHIISSGVMTYTNDERFQVIHPADDSEDWDLQIKFVQKRDNGTYECQVATSSGIISHYYNLHVVVPAAFILGSGDYHIGEGSTISLVCIIENSPTPPQYVFWYHNDRMVNYDSSGSVSVSTEPGPKTHSRLMVNKATPADSGNYTCRAPNTEPDTMHVFVSKEGENTAAIQRASSHGASAFGFDGSLLRLLTLLATSSVLM